MTLMSHDVLVQAARNWLLNTKRLRVIAAELSTVASETPDAIGFGNETSCLIECKVSRADFAADKNKACRKSGYEAGQWRWYLAPQGILRPDDVAGSDWGLLEYVKSGHARGYYIREVVFATPREYTERTRKTEHAMLVSIAWRAMEAQKLTRPLAIGAEER
jgi:hypothetical protein